MLKDSLKRIFDEKNKILWIYNEIQTLGDQVLCPMCEVWHENNTLCQMNFI